MIQFLKKYCLSILVTLIIFVLCFMNTAPLPAAPMTNFDKIVHVIMFLGLSGVIFFDSTKYLRFPVSQKQVFFGILLFPIAIGGITEIGQEYLTLTRSGDWYDFLFDAIGSILGYGIALLINRYLSRSII